ncbi:MAG TPA: DNA replication/repair protein RecF [Geobacteraceae bacterium]|nr:DNA replication/repair protein RecF [Geobacteraceae bacterium]
MRLRKLSLAGFRNLRHVELLPGSRFNIIHGKNAQGKTNLLESIYLLGTMKSFRMAKNGEMVMWGEPSGSIGGIVERDGVTREILLLVDKSGKKVRLDSKPVVKLADFFGSLNVVIFSPEDIGMVRGMPDGRRKYLDRAVFSGDASYLFFYHEYFRTLRNRNILLRNGDDGGLAAWSEKLVEAGARLIASRIAYLKEIEVFLREFYGAIAGGGVTAGISYRPHLSAADKYTGDFRAVLAAALAASAAEERRAGSTVVGPHRDDVDFLLNGKIMKHHASQGEQRSFVLALKMAEIEYIQRRHGNPPVLLLDDMTSELDRERNGNLMEFLKQKEMQVFITTTAPENLILDNSSNNRSFLVEAGQVYN